jgi:hypothetical protein
VLYLALLHVRLPVDDEHLLVFEQEVAVVVAEVVGVALRAGLLEDGAVAAQDGVDAEHELLAAVLKPACVVGICPALVGAEALVESPAHGDAALLALFLIFHWNIRFMKRIVALINAVMCFKKRVSQRRGLLLAEINPRRYAADLQHGPCPIPEHPRARGQDTHPTLLSL